MLDRTWLSIDGIVNGDLPATAITGYGFQFARKRPVSDVRVVRNLGLRKAVCFFLSFFLSHRIRCRCVTMLPYHQAST